jgi:hypothetical protein
LKCFPGFNTCAKIPGAPSTALPTLSPTTASPTVKASPNPNPFQNSATAFGVGHNFIVFIVFFAIYLLR